MRILDAQFVCFQTIKVSVARNALAKVSVKLIERVDKGGAPGLLLYRSTHNTFDSPATIGELQPTKYFNHVCKKHIRHPTRHRENNAKNKFFTKLYNRMELHLQSFGTKLRATGKLFKITKTDLEQHRADETEEYAAHQVESLLFYKGTSVSIDALLLALEHDITTVILDKYKQPVGYLFPTKPSSTIAIWKQQIAISLSSEGLQFAKAWIEEKVKVRIEFLQKIANRRTDKKRDVLLQAVTDMTRSLENIRFVHIGGDPKAAAHTLRGHEGTASRPYYAALSDTLPEMYRFKGRSYHPANDAFNAFLNYGYGILYRHCTRALWMAGVNPYIGFMHYDGYQRHSLTFDFVEPFRVWVEKTVYSLFLSKRVSGQHVVVKPETGYELTKTGCWLLAMMLDKRLAERKLLLDNREFVKENYLQERARRFSSRMLPRHQS